MKITERGWCNYLVGHQWCSFRRNTLLEEGDDKIVVATIGGFVDPLTFEPAKIPGTNVWYTTMVGKAINYDGYQEIDFNNMIPVHSDHDIEGDSWQEVCEEYDMIDMYVNEMHDEVVNEVSQNILGTNKELLPFYPVNNKGEN